MSGTGIASEPVAGAEGAPFPFCCPSCRAPLAAEPDRFELVFCDPPYDDPAEPIVEALGAGTWWTTAAVLEHPSARAPEPPAGFDADTRRYGDTGVTILRRPAGTA